MFVNATSDRLKKKTECRHFEEPFAALEGKLRDEESAFYVIDTAQQQILRCAQDDKKRTSSVKIQQAANG
jgi:hypothetical protein